MQTSVHGNLKRQLLYKMYKTLTFFNDQKNTPLSNEKIQEAMLKVIEEESISDTNHVTLDTFTHTYNTQRDNENLVFTSEKLDELDKLTDTIDLV